MDAFAVFAALSAPKVQFTNGKLMGGMFSTRKLNIKKISSKPHGESAVAEFYWEFDAP